MGATKYKRVVLKLSGESLAGEQGGTALEGNPTLHPWGLKEDTRWLLEGADSQGCGALKA